VVLASRRAPADGDVQEDLLAIVIKALIDDLVPA